MAGAAELGLPGEPAGGEVQALSWAAGTHLGSLGRDGSWCCGSERVEGVPGEELGMREPPARQGLVLKLDGKEAPLEGTLRTVVSCPSRITLPCSVPGGDLWLPYLSPSLRPHVPVLSVPASECTQRGWYPIALPLGPSVGF